MGKPFLDADGVKFLWDKVKTLVSNAVSGLRTELYNDMGYIGNVSVDELDYLILNDIVAGTRPSIYTVFKELDDGHTQYIGLLHVVCDLTTYSATQIFYTNYGLDAGMDLDLTTTSTTVNELRRRVVSDDFEYGVLAYGAWEYYNPITINTIHDRIQHYVDSENVMRYKGRLYYDDYDSNSDPNKGEGRGSLPTNQGIEVSAGWFYIVDRDGTFATHVCNQGDKIMCTTDHICNGTNATLTGGYWAKL